MIGTPHLPTRIPHPLVSLGTLADTQGYDYKHLFTRLTYMALYSSPLNYYIAIVHADQYQQLRWQRMPVALNQILMCTSVQNQDLISFDFLTHP